MSATILFLSANPSGTPSLKLDDEQRCIHEERERAPRGPAERLTVAPLPAVRVADFRRGMARHDPVVVHFAGHGEVRATEPGDGKDGAAAGSAGHGEVRATETPDGEAGATGAREVQRPKSAAGGHDARPGELLVLDDGGRAVPVPLAAMAELFRLHRRVRLVVLNACHTLALAEAVAEHVDCAIGTTGAVPDEVAITFARGLYAALFNGRSVQDAFDLGKNEVRAKGTSDPDAMLALRCREGVDPGKVFVHAERTAHGDAGVPGNLPARRLFVGRRDELAAVHERLAAAGVAGITQRVSVFGLGGIGKSSLALAYAHEHLADYPGGVYWVRAEGDPVSALLGFSAELRAVAPPDVAEVLARVPLNDAMAIAAGVRLALQAARQPSLLVLDNVDADWSAHLPGGRVHVLMTTREPDLAPGGEAARVRLDVLGDEDAVAMADLLAGDCAEADRAARDRVVLEELGALAVAVEMAARAVKRWTKTWGRYEVELHRQAEVLLEDPKLREAYPRGAFAALDLSIARCTDATARALLESLAALAPEGAPVAWVEAGAGVEAGTLAAARAWEDLTDAGLVKSGGDHGEAALHRLVHRRLASTMSAEQREARAAAMAEVVLAWLGATVDPGRIAEVAPRVPHVERVLAAVERRGEMRTWIAVADRVATHLQHRGLYAAARALFQRALDAAEQLVPPDKDRIAVQLSNLALVLKELGDAAAARPLLERALRITEKALGPDHLNVAIRLSNLAVVLKDLGDATAARPLLERALRIDEDALDPDHPGVAIRLSNLALVLNDLGDAAAARPLLERALRIDENALGPDHPSIAIDLSNLAVVLRELGDATAARPLLERALRIDEDALDPDHPNVAIDLSNLALMLRELGDATAARPLLERALSITEKALDPGHPSVAILLSNLAAVLNDLGDAAAAHPLLERALRIHENALGPDHPNVAIGLNNLATMLRDLGDAAAARLLLERALRIGEKALGPDHPSVAVFLEKLAKVLQDLGDAAGAQRMDRRAGEIRQARLAATRAREPSRPPHES